MNTKKDIKYQSETILLIVGSLLLIISFLLFHYEKIIQVGNEIYNSIQNEIFKESTSNNRLSVNINVNYLEQTNEGKKDTNYTPNYIGFLEIEKINLKQGLLPINNYYNNVDYHIEILKVSDLPDVINGNMILASHSGNSSISYFRNLYKLDLGDTAKIYYNGKVYKYQIVNIYKEDKDGSVAIYRDSSKTTLTLITCSKNDKTHQTIYILELIGVETY